MELKLVKIEKPEEVNFILGQSHFIKTVEDLKAGFFPLSVLNAVKMVPEVCHIYCATANPVEVIIAETDQGRGILGVVDGLLTKGIEGDEDIRWRKDFLRKIGYKLG
jgi:adenosine/AMP kinase